MSLRYFWHDFWNFFPEGLLPVGIHHFEVLFPTVFSWLLQCRRRGASGLTLVLTLSTPTRVVFETARVVIGTLFLWLPFGSNLFAFVHHFSRLCCLFVLPMLLSRFDRLWPQISIPYLLSQGLLYHVFQSLITRSSSYRANIVFSSSEFPILILYRLLQHVITGCFVDRLGELHPISHQTFGHQPT